MGSSREFEDLAVLLLGAEGPADLVGPLTAALQGSCRLLQPQLESKSEQELDHALEGVREQEKAADVVLLVSPDPGPSFLRGWLEVLGRHLPDLPVVAVARLEAAEQAVGLLEAGAADYLSPPFGAVDIIPRLWRLVRDAGSAGTVLTPLKRKIGLKRLVGHSDVFRKLVDKIPVYARSDATVLMQGETGTGKELVARTLHYLSPRADKPFVPVNCGAIPVDLFENELFGHERSAFTGAADARPGLIDEANQGSLFLDEIDALTPNAQSKLLRFLQDKEYRRLGSTKSRLADLRLIAATNSDVAKAVDEGHLRRDLFYRLNVLPLVLPTLRERAEDILLLADHFLQEYSRKYKRPVPTLSPKAENALLLHEWPGNVRELEHVMERAVLLGKEGKVAWESDLLLGHTRTKSPTTFREAKAQVVARFERSYVKGLLQANRGNISQAARVANKNRRAFWELIRRHHIDVDRYRQGRSQREP